MAEEALWPPLGFDDIQGLPGMSCRAWMSWGGSEWSGTTVVAVRCSRLETELFTKMAASRVAGW